MNSVTAHDSRHVAVLMGGTSNEREISLSSGSAATTALRSVGLRVTEVDVGPQVASDLIALQPDVAFIALHGRGGEDGTIQGLLASLNIPYTGSDVTASAAASDKLLTKRLLHAAGIPTPAFQEVTAIAAQANGTPVLDLPWPVMVKPNRGGSSIGIRRVDAPGDCASAIAEALAEDARALAEVHVTGRELTVGVIADEPLPVVEIIPPDGIFSFAAKYRKKGTDYQVPAKLPDSVRATVTEYALATYRTLGCSGAARVDLMLDAKQQAWVLEINTIPGLTPTSLLPMAAAAAHIPFEQLILRMLDRAVTP